ncbi:MAG: hypothetical protein IJM81_05000, partial [Prevotella sp.]|nr:hypothetical protein [Prevotella sp.]
PFTPLLFRNIYVSPHKTWSFALRKTVFCKVKAYLSQVNNRAFAIRAISPDKSDGTYSTENQQLGKNIKKTADFAWKARSAEKFSFSVLKALQILT